MPSTHDLSDDLQAAIDRLQQAGTDAVEQRRAFREVLAVLYDLREYRKTQHGEAPYYAEADGCLEGRVTEGIIALRGARVHDVTNESRPEPRPLYPSDRLFPGTHLHPGHNLTWRQQTDMTWPLATWSKKGLSFYDADVAGLPVSQTLAMAQAFLAGPRWLGAL